MKIETLKNDYQKMKRLISKIEYQTADKYWVKHSEKKSKIDIKNRSWSEGQTYKIEGVNVYKEQLEHDIAKLAIKIKEMERETHY